MRMEGVSLGCVIYMYIAAGFLPTPLLHKSGRHEEGWKRKKKKDGSPE